jgi:hypothetical protein
MHRLTEHDSETRLIDRRQPISTEELERLHRDGWRFLGREVLHDLGRDRPYRHAFRHTSALPPGAI